MNRTRVRQIIRTLINEALIKETVGDPEVQSVLNRIISSKDLGVEIVHKGNNFLVFSVVRYAEEKSMVDDFTGDFSFSMNPAPSKQVLAYLELEKGKNHFTVDPDEDPVSMKSPPNCSNAWEVAFAYANETGKKWGRFLYDVAIEKLGAIMSDRESVSELARKVWSKLRSRDDIERLQLDDIYNTLTDTVDDNCDMAPWSVNSEPGEHFFISDEERSSPEYEDRLRAHDLSAAYAKKGGETPVIDALSRANKLKEIGS